MVWHIIAHKKAQQEWKKRKNAITTSSGWIYSAPNLELDGGKLTDDVSIELMFIVLRAPFQTVNLGLPYILNAAMIQFLQEIAINI